MDTEVSTAHTDELDALRRRVAELERALAAQQGASRGAEQFSPGQFHRLLEAVPDAIVIIDGSGTIISSNKQAEHMFGYAPGALLGQPIEALLPERFRAAHHGHRSSYLASPRVRPMGSGLALTGQRRDGSEFPVEISLSPMETEAGLQVIGSIRDITARQQAEQERARLQAEMIQAQEALLHELSSPLIPITDQVIVVPLIGTINERRSKQIAASLLQGIGASRVHSVLIDITGVPVIDTQVAKMLVETAAMIGLLGARVILSGIRPEIAQTLVSLGVSLRGIETCASLQSGLSAAISGEGHKN
jgi:rsbT co-antagonist protein RsbR